MSRWRVVDPTATFPVYAVEVVADDEDEARVIAAEAMAGTPLNAIAANVAEEIVESLEVTRI